MNRNSNYLTTLRGNRPSETT